jgi:S-adenosylmethionine hydrolase
MNFISFLTDFGILQEYVGVCKAVMLSINPNTVILDISHTVSPYNIKEAAFMLKNFVQYSPPCVHIAVVDPGVGTERRGIAIETARGDFLVGPDNGVLMWAAESLTVQDVVFLETRKYMLHTVSSSFHGRDIFSPAGAHLSRGVSLAELGPSVEKTDLHSLPYPTWTKKKHSIAGTVVRIDRFGNIQTSIEASTLQDRKKVTIVMGDQKLVIPVVKTFGEVNKGEFLIYEDSDGLLTLAQNQGDAAQELHITPSFHLNILL